MSAELTRMARFGIVGISNTVVTFAAFAILTAAGLPAAPASAIAFGVGAINGYRLNRGWTFRVTDTDGATVVRYVAVQGLGAGLSAIGLAAATSDLSLSHLAAEACVLPFVTITTYLLSRTIVFGGPDTA